MKLLFKLTADDYGLTSERRNSLLSRLMILILLLTLISFVADKIIRSNISTVIFLSIGFACILVLLLNKLQYYKSAKIVGLLIFNFIVYNISVVEPIELGFHIHLFTTAFAALVLFGHEDRIWGLLFILLSFFLYIHSAFEASSIYKEKMFTDYHAKISLILNCILFGFINVYLFVMILRLNYKAEEKLVLTNKNISIQNEELKKINKELDRFVYSASHDLRAPISSITGLLALQKIDPTATHDYLVKIEDRVQAMDRFICDILDYHKNTRTDVEYKKLNLQNLVSQLVEMMKYTDSTKKLSFTLDIPAGIILNTDSFRIRVILNNLISNAIKYADYRKPDPYVKITAYLNETICYIKVIDNGIGIDDTMQPKVFDMFYRATTSAQGSGLGLYILKESLDKLQGTVSLHSKVGLGSTFTIALPC